VEVENANYPNHALKVFPNLRILHVHGCQSLESIFPITFAQSLERLEKIVIWYNFGLNYVFGTHNDYNNSSGSEAKTNINLLALRKISLVSLSNLIDIFPSYCHPNSPNLKRDRMQRMSSLVNQCNVQDSDRFRSAERSHGYRGKDSNIFSFT